MSNTQNLALIILLDCFCCKMEHLYYIVSLIQMKRSPWSGVIHGNNIFLNPTSSNAYSEDEELMFRLQFCGLQSTYQHTCVSTYVLNPIM